MRLILSDLMRLILSVFLENLQKHPGTLPTVLSFVSSFIFDIHNMGPMGTSSGRPGPH
jgi:hypothetical protein